MDDLIHSCIDYRCKNEYIFNKIKASRHIAAIFTKKNKILSFGMNYLPLNKDRSIHAEVSALENLNNFIDKNKKKYKNLYMIVLRIDSLSDEINYKLVNSKPCICCLSKISDYKKKGINIKKIYYSNNYSFIESKKLNDFFLEKPILSSFDRKYIEYNKLPEKVKQYLSKAF